MPTLFTRRSLLRAAGIGAATQVLPALSSAAPARAPAWSELLTALEAELGGLVGACALDTGSGARLTHRADERFAMCSTFKLPLAAAVLAKVDAGQLSLDAPVHFSARDMLPYAPITSAHLQAGVMTVGALCEAAVTVSDNPAANLLLPHVGGPSGLTRFLRELGDPVTRLDRTEPELNSNLPGDVRDTTTPRAMVTTVQALLLGSSLHPASREQLIGWMRACTTGAARLRAGFPADWRAGDKTGTGTRGAANDVAIVWPPQRAPWIVAVYLSGSRRKPAELNEAHRRIALAVVASFGPAADDNAPHETPR